MSVTTVFTDELVSSAQSCLTQYEDIQLMGQECNSTFCIEDTDHLEAISVTCDDCQWIMRKLYKSSETLAENSSGNSVSYHLQVQFE
jgi:hypothetical protein